MKAFIEANFKMIDIDSDGIIGAKEFRYNCITRIAVDNIQVVDDAFEKLLDVSNSKIPWALFSIWSRPVLNCIYFYCFTSFYVKRTNKKYTGRRSTTGWIDIGKIPRIIWSLFGQYRRNTSWCLPIRTIEPINCDLSPTHYIL